MSGGTEVIRTTHDGVVRFKGYGDASEGLKKAIVVLPGFLGSRLYAGDDIRKGESVRFARGERLWIFNPITEGSIVLSWDDESAIPSVEARFDEEDRVEALACNEDGTSVNNVVASWEGYRQTLDEGYGTAGTYTALVNALKTVHEDVRFMPYDWRLGIKAAEEALHTVLDYLITTNDILYIVAHSMGGLVALLYAKTCKDPDKLRLITLGAPFYGAPGALRVMESGKALPLGFCSKALKKIAGNIQSAYDLLPTRQYGSYIVVEDGASLKAVSVKDTAALLESPELGLNKRLLENSRTLTESFDAAHTYKSLPFVCSVVGYGKETPVKAQISKMEDVLVPTAQVSDITAISGDGTVSLDSATMRGAIPARHLAHVFEKHAKLPANRGVIGYVLAKINNWDSPEKSRYGYDTQTITPTATPADPPSPLGEDFNAKALEGSDIHVTITTAKWHNFSLNPAYLFDIYDNCVGSIKCDCSIHKGVITKKGEAENGVLKLTFKHRGTDDTNRYYVDLPKGSAYTISVVAHPFEPDVVVLSMIGEKAIVFDSVIFEVSY